MPRRALRKCVNCGTERVTTANYHKWRKNGIYHYCGSFRVIDRDSDTAPVDIPP